MSVQSVNSFQRLHRKTRTYQLAFSSPLNPSVAGNAGNYHVVPLHHSRRSPATAVKVRGVSYNAASNTVTLTLGASAPQGPLQVTITGLGGAGISGATITTTL